MKWYWKIIAINEMNNDLSKRGPSIEIIDIRNVTTEAANNKPDNRPINVPKEDTEFNKSFIVSNILLAFLAYDKNKTDKTPSVIPIISGKEKNTLSITTSRKAIKITSVFEKAIPAAKLLWEKTFINT